MYKLIHLSHVAHSSWANIEKLRNGSVVQGLEISTLSILSQLSICQQWPAEILATMARQTFRNNE